jgi:hypothetical protein
MTQVIGSQLIVAAELSRSVRPQPKCGSAPGIAIALEPATRGHLAPQPKVVATGVPDISERLARGRQGHTR